MTTRGLSDLLLASVVATSMIAFGLAAQVHGVWVVGLLSIVVAAMVSGPTLDGRPARRGIVTALLVVVIATTALRTIGVGVTVELFCEFVILLLAVKMLDRRSPRDASQIATLSIFLTIGAVLTSSTLQTGAAVIAFVLAVLAWSFVHQMVAARFSTHVRPPVAHPGRLRRDAVSLTFVTCLLGSLLGGVIFVLIPRGLAPQVLGDWGSPSTAATTGFSDTVELGAAGIISESSTPVLHLQIRNRGGDIVGGLGETVYLRGAVLDTYDDGAWIASARPDLDARERIGQGAFKAISTQQSLSARDDRMWSVEQNITIRSAPSGVSPVFAAWRPLAVRFDQTERIISKPSGRGSNALLSGVVYRAGSSGTYSYTVRSTPLIDTRSIFLPDDDRPYPESFPSEPIRELAQEILGEANIDPDPTVRPFREDALAARAIENYLRSRYVYSLEPGRVPRGRDPIEWFLFDEDSGAGHCEYFASAMAALCRSIGVHARVITGYVAADYNEISEHYLVRQSNAHAWVEVLVGVDRWRTYDPTPPAEFRRLHQRPSGLWTTIQRAIESIEYAWVTGVVGYSADVQSDLLGEITPPVVGKWFSERVDRRAGDHSNARLVRTAALAGMGAFFAGLLLGSVWLAAAPRLWSLLSRTAGFTWGRSHTASEPDPEAIRRAHKHVLRRLARAGTPRPAHVPLATHAAGVKDTELRSDAELVAGALYAWRFGGVSPSPDVASALSQVSRSGRKSS